MMFFLLLILHFPSIKSLSVDNLRSNYDIYGSRMASNDVVVVLAQNDISRYIFMFTPFGPENYCGYPYASPSDFILTIAIRQRPIRDLTWIVYLSTNEYTVDELQLGVVFVNQSNCFNSTDDAGTGEKLMHRLHAESNYMSTLRLDPLEDYVYGFLQTYAFIFDINTPIIKKFPWKELLPNVPEFFPRDAAVTITHDGVRIAIIVGYFEVGVDSTLPVAYLLRLQPPLNISLLDNFTLSNDNIVSKGFAYSYTFDYVMSVSIEPDTQRVLIGLPSYEKTFLLEYNSEKLSYLKSFSQPARSVTWLDNRTQAALLLSNVPTLPWAYSQVKVINVSYNDSEQATCYAIPNNQQTIILKTPQQSNHFIRVAVNKGQPVILTSSGFMIYAPHAPEGHFIGLTEIISHKNTAQLCPAGTFKNHKGQGPCTICPTGYKNPILNKSALVTNNQTLLTHIECIPCLSQLFCPLGSINDVNLSHYPSINEAYAYPNSPPSTNYDDIILRNTFQIDNSSNHCLRVSPMFWTLIVLGIAGIILIIMGIFYSIRKAKPYFQFLTRIFRHTDLVGEGELWIGGLLSFAIVVLITFAFWFGTVYVKQYPIEGSGNSNFACDTTLRNAKFTSSLQMLAMRRLEEEQFIIDLLDKQNWIMTVDFIQTGFQCQDISIQNNLGSYKVKVPIRSCFLRPDYATRTVIIPLPSHTLDLQFNLTGNSVIGAIRVCLDGLSKTVNARYSTVQKLSFCRLLSNSNQTLPQMANIKLHLTKMINRTEGLHATDAIVYSGVWIPALKIKSMNDHIAYEQQGAYLRYLSSQKIIAIEFSETPFFIKNNQEPITTLGEIVFHNILLFTACIELCALVFLVFKLAILPLCQRIFFAITNRFQKKKDPSTIV